MPKQRSYPVVNPAAAPKPKSQPLLPAALTPAQLEARLQQRSAKFADRRTARLRDRGAQRRHSIAEGS